MALKWRKTFILGTPQNRKSSRQTAAAERPTYSQFFFLLVNRPDSKPTGFTRASFERGEAACVRPSACAAPFAL